MTQATMPAELLLHIRKEIDIDAPVAITYEALLEQLGPACQMPDGKPMPMKFEPWPGGRWFRDLGNDTGHFWGHVQVIKPPKLIEITGKGNGTHLALVHRAMGEILPEHRDGMPEGWEYYLERVRELAEKRKANAAKGR